MPGHKRLRTEKKLEQYAHQLWAQNVCAKRIEGIEAQYTALQKEKKKIDQSLSHLDARLKRNQERQNSHVQKSGNATVSFNAIDLQPEIQQYFGESPEQLWIPLLATLEAYPSEACKILLTILTYENHTQKYIFFAKETIDTAKICLEWMTSLMAEENPDALKSSIIKFMSHYFSVAVKHALSNQPYAELLLLSPSGNLLKTTLQLPLVSATPGASGSGTPRVSIAGLFRAETGGVMRPARSVDTIASADTATADVTDDVAQDSVVSRDNAVEHGDKRRRISLSSHGSETSSLNELPVLVTGAAQIS